MTEKTTLKTCRPWIFLITLNIVLNSVQVIPDIPLYWDRWIVSSTTKENQVWTWAYNKVREKETFVLHVDNIKVCDLKKDRFSLKSDIRKFVS